jgi:hypothetical protein
MCPSVAELGFKTWVFPRIIKVKIQELEYQISKLLISKSLNQYLQPRIQDPRTRVSRIEPDVVLLAAPAPERPCAVCSTLLRRSAAAACCPAAQLLLVLAARSECRRIVILELR